MRGDLYRGFESLTLRGNRSKTDEEAAADRPRGRRGRAGVGSARRARFQPLLLAGAYLTVLPAMLESEHPARLVLLVAGAGFAAVGVAAWWWGEVGAPPDRQRDRIGVLLALISAPAVLVVAAVLGAERPEAYLPLGAASMCSVAPVGRWTVRLPVQVVTVVIYAGLLVRVGRPVSELLLLLVLLVSVGVLATTMARDLDQVRAAERAARQDAQRRADLLAAVRALPGTTMEEAAAGACTTMRSLGFDAASCAVFRGDRLVTLHHEGEAVDAAPPDGSEGLVRSCSTENRTIVVGDHRAAPGWFGSRPGVGSAVMAPIRVDGEALGCLMGARHRRGVPTSAEVEVAEVLAAHLGAVLATDEAVRRQRELLARMGQLETMRSNFVDQVSDELRDPLTVVRGAAATLAAHGPELEPSQRNRLFDRMGQQSDRLRRTIDALLDFSRFQATRPEPTIEPIDLGTLLEAVVRSSEAVISEDEVALTTLVSVDGGLFRYALELLLAGIGAVDPPPRLRVARRGSIVEIEIEVDAGSTVMPPTLVRSLAAQLLVVAGAELAPGRALVLRLTVADVEAVLA